MGPEGAAEGELLKWIQIKTTHNKKIHAMGNSDWNVNIEHGVGKNTEVCFFSSLPPSCS